MVEVPTSRLVKLACKVPAPNQAPNRIAMRTWRPLMPPIVNACHLHWVIGSHKALVPLANPQALKVLASSWSTPIGLHPPAILSPPLFTFLPSYASSSLWNTQALSIFSCWESIVRITCNWDQHRYRSLLVITVEHTTNALDMLLVAMEQCFKSSYSSGYINMKLTLNYNAKILDFLTTSIPLTIDL